MLLAGLAKLVSIPIVIWISKQRLDFSELRLQPRQLGLDFGDSPFDRGTLLIVAISYFGLDQLALALLVLRRDLSGGTCPGGHGGTLHPL